MLGFFFPMFSKPSILCCSDMLCLSSHIQPLTPNKIPNERIRTKTRLTIQLISLSAGRPLPQCGTPGYLLT